jgi:exodeoxyribonuclease VII large subunit
LDRMRQTLGYEATLARGYAVVRGDGAVVTGVKAAENATALEIQFADGRMVVGGKAKKPTPKAPPEQGSLL